MNAKQEDDDEEESENGNVDFEEISAKFDPTKFFSSPFAKTFFSDSSGHRDSSNRFVSLDDRAKRNRGKGKKRKPKRNKVRVRFQKYFKQKHKGRS
jgi:hypothetical protein